MSENLSMITICVKFPFSLVEFINTGIVASSMIQPGMNFAKQKTDIPFVMWLYSTEE